MKIIIYLTFVICLSSALSPQKHKKYRSSSSDYESPYEKEERALREALYCNDDDMQKGDNCYCGRISISCCESKDKCTGTLSRHCSKTVDDYKCDSQVTKGLSYWQEMKNLEDKIECSNEHYDKNSPCICGKMMTSCCKSKSHCDVGLLSETCDSKLDDKKCESIKLSLTNMAKPKYYTEYFQLFSSSEKVQMLSVFAMSICFIIFMI